MNSEIKRLEYKKNKLRKQNLEKQKQLLSNNLYINNSLSNKIPLKIKSNKNSRYNSLIKNNNNSSNSSLILNYKNKKNKSYAKLPFKKGMFSYKNNLMNSTPNNMYKNINNISANRINYKNNNNNSLLSANLKLNLDNDDNDNNISQNIIIHGRISSSSSFDLNKYKIIDKNLINHLRPKNMTYSNYSNRNSHKNVGIYNNSNILNKKTFTSKHNNIIINTFNNNNINNNLNNNLNNNMNNSKINNNKLSQNSLEMFKISPIIPKLVNNKENNSPSLLIIDDYKDNININSTKNLSNKKRKIFDHFKDKPDNEKESRRMIIEYIKVLKQKKYRNQPEPDINTIMIKNNISKKVLNKELTFKEFNSSNIYNSFINIKNNKNNETNSIQSSLNNSLINNFNNSVVNINNKVLSKNFQSPIKNNISNFLTNMNDEKKDKINMIKYLSTPKYMNIIFLQKKYKYLCLLCPNNLSYINAIESYIFKFVDLKHNKPVGGFDLIKVNVCSLNNNNPKNFFVETYDGKTQRNYEFETNSKDTASYCVKSINYLSQLEKCKIYNNKNIFL